MQNHYFIVIFMPGVYPWPRLGITASRRVGNAVTRNRLKRIIREWFRLNKRAVTASLDINIIAKKSAAELTSGEVFVSLNKIFESVWESRH